MSRELRDSDLHGSTDSGFGSGKPSLQTEESQFLLPGAQTQIQGTLGNEEPLELPDHCGDNTDSGICLQESNLHSSMGPTWKQQFGYTHQGQDDSDVNLVQNSPGQPTYAQDGSALGHVCLLEPRTPEEKKQVTVAFQGYQKQTRWKEETADPPEHLDKESPLTTDAFDPKLGVCLQGGLAWSPPALAKGYVKQESQGLTTAPSGTTSRQWDQLAEGWSLLDAVSFEDLSIMSWTSAHQLAPLDCEAAPGGLPSSLDANMVTLPLISSLQVDE